MKLSVVICTHNPAADRLFATLDGLKAQTLPADVWETILIDNASDRFPAQDMIDAHAPANMRIVREPELGLTAARLAGFAAARAELLVMVDDDNELAQDFLERGVDFAGKNPQVGTFGGKSLPCYECAPPGWFAGTGISLGCRDLGDRTITFVPPGAGPLEGYPPVSPIGAGMFLRRAVADQYRVALAARKGRAITDRRGASLSSGGDCDMVLCSLEKGWATAYEPSLVLNHLIPGERLTPGYLGRLNRESSHSWVLLLDIHGIRPWPAIPRWTSGPRKLRSWLRFRAWSGEGRRIAWLGICGRIDAQAILEP